MKFKKILLVPLMLISLASCQPAEKCMVRVGEECDELLTTPITDSFRFKQANELDGKKFAGKDGETYDNLGYVTLRSCTDGDTANFTQEGFVDETNSPISIKTRFLGVNTPESTAKVEPWGKKASLWVKGVLESAQADADSKSTTSNKVYNIALINHPTSKGGPFEEKDSAGNRWLAFVWYRPTTDSNWRLLNLELVEQAYSENYLFDDDDVCDYLEVFQKAEAKVKKCGYRVHGERDWGYDYEEHPYVYSLWAIINHYEEIGISSETGSSGLQLIVTALVVGIQGDNMFLRDVFLDEEQVELGDMEYAGLYAYAGFNSGIGSNLKTMSEQIGMDGTGTGIVVRFFCRATYYGGNVQLSDVKPQTSSVDKKGFRFLTNENTFNKYKDEYTWSHLYNEQGEVYFEDLNNNIDPIAIDPLQVTGNEYLSQYHYQFISTELQVRSVQPTDVDEDGNPIGGESPYWYKGSGDPNNKSYTVYTQFVNSSGRRVYSNIRIDTSLYPFIEPSFFGTSDAFDLTSENSPVGKTFHVTGYLALYFDKYQILLPNNHRSKNYIYPVS